MNLKEKIIELIMIIQPNKGYNISLGGDVVKVQE